jgi:plastocyanin
MRTFARFLLVGAILGMASTNARAGGDDNGGAKDDGTIVVENDYDGYVMAVAVSDEAPSSVSEFLAQGAQIVQPGDSVEFHVAGGAHTVTALFIQDVSPFDIVTDTLTVEVDGSATTTIVGVQPGVLQD